MKHWRKHIQIEEGKDQVTLFTCTPYGVNSHRLLVRGTRVPYNGEEDATESVTDSMVKAIQNYYNALFNFRTFNLRILVIILLRFLSKKKSSQRITKIFKEDMRRWWINDLKQGKYFSLSCRSYISTAHSSECESRKRDQYRTEVFYRIRH